MGKMAPMNSSGLLRTLHSTLALAVIMLIATAPAFAQTPAPQNAAAIFIKGTVRDASGAPITDAAVILEEKTRSESVEGKTDKDGTFSFLAMKAGTYVVRAKKPGFREASTPPMELSSPDKKKIDLVLKPLKKRAAQR
jgi:Carboxypeptidase regulatory-like domain